MAVIREFTTTMKKKFIPQDQAFAEFLNEFGDLSGYSRRDVRKSFAFWREDLIKDKRYSTDASADKLTAYILNHGYKLIRARNLNKINEKSSAYNAFATRQTSKVIVYKKINEN